MSDRQYVDRIRANEACFTDDETGRTVVTWFVGFDPEASRYRYDGKLLPEGWKQWDTKQDASYFGMWVHPERHETFSYAEGDCTQTFCRDADAFRELLRVMEHFHGNPPPMAVAYDVDGTRTEYYDDRLKPEDIK